MIAISNFDETPSGPTVPLFTLTNKNGMTVKIIGYGAIITELWVPNRDGDFENVVLGFDSVEAYQYENMHAGAIVGRVAGRISGGKFTLDGVDHQLAQNEFPNHLHGGANGFDKRMWTAKTLKEKDGQGEILELEYFSPDGEEGYPGNLEVSVTYRLTDDNGFQIGFRATTDKTTPISLTDHSYFNLARAGSGTIKNHIVQIDADRFAPIKPDFTFTGELKTVQKSITDFREPVKMEHFLGDLHGHGEVYALSNEGKFEKVARVAEPKSGRTLEVFTDQPYLQLYNSKYLETAHKANTGRTCGPHQFLCLECQGFSDAPNHAHFESIYLSPDQVYQRTILYRFGVES